MEREGDGDTSCNWCTWNDLQRICKGSGRLSNQKTSREHPDSSVTKIAVNPEKSPGDLRKLAVTQTLEKNYQVTLV